MGRPFLPWSVANESMGLGGDFRGSQIPAGIRSSGPAVQVAGLTIDRKDPSYSARKKNGCVVADLDFVHGRRSTIRVEANRPVEGSVMAALSMKTSRGINPKVGSGTPVGEMAPRATQMAEKCIEWSVYWQAIQI